MDFVPKKTGNHQIPRLRISYDVTLRDTLLDQLV